MTSASFDFSPRNTGNKASGVKQYLANFPAEEFFTASGKAKVGEVFSRIEKMCRDEEQSYAGMLFARIVAKDLLSRLTSTEEKYFARDVALLQEHKVFDLTDLTHAKAIARLSFDGHVKNGGKFDDWAPRRVCDELLNSSDLRRAVAPYWSEDMTWQIDPASPSYKLKQLLGVYLVAPDLLGVLKLSFERTLAIHHLRNSNVIKNLIKESPALLARADLTGNTPQQVIADILSRSEWLQHRDAYVANALYGKGRNGKAFIDTVKDKPWALRKVTQNMLSYKPRPDSMGAFVTMVIDLASHLGQADNDRPFQELAKLLTLPMMADELDLDDVVARIGMLNLGDDVISQILRMQEINRLKGDEKAWVRALVDDGLQKEVMKHLEKQYPVRKERMFKLQEFGLLDDRGSSMSLMESVLMEDLGL